MGYVGMVFGGGDVIAAGGVVRDKGGVFSCAENGCGRAGCAHRVLESPARRWFCAPDLVR